MAGLKFIIYSLAPRFIKEKFKTYAVIKYLDLLEKQGMQPFIVGGSTLAILRENRLFLKHDTDFDAGILLKNWDPRIKDVLQRNGYTIIQEFGKPEHGYNLSVTRLGLKIDLFIFYKSGDKSWDSIWVTDAEGKRHIRYHTYPQDTFDEREFRVVKGNRVPVPVKILQYVETAYGPGWRTPITDWDWAGDHSCNDLEFLPSEQELPQSSAHTAISVQHIHKSFLVKGYLREEVLATALIGDTFRFFRGQKKPVSTVEVLSDINFEVNSGEVLGIIGPNGAGKSTLLKIISRITEPTRGRVMVYGRIASLMEVGTGFHYDLTGRENIMVNGAMLGMSKREIQLKFDEIVDFSGIEKFIDMPLKRYSTGMASRLGFAVAAFLDAEILLMDEVLSVGDAEFQKKCLNKMNELSHGEGRTILFVSHNMGAVLNVCERAIFLKKGRIVADGQAQEVINRYLQENLTEGAVVEQEKIDQLFENLWGNARQRINLTRIAIVDSDGLQRTDFNAFEEINIQVSFRVSNNAVNDIRIAVSLVDDNGIYLMTSQTGDSIEFIQNYTVLGPGSYTVTCTVPPNMLGNKRYFLNVDVNHPYHGHFVVRNVLSFSVSFQGYNNLQRAPFQDAYFRPQLSWRLNTDA